MKNIIKSIIAIFIILTIIIPFNIFSQGCLPNGITFTTQSQIDSFPINYPNCIVIEGGLIITGSNITNLNGLNSIHKIVGSLTVFNTDSLINFNGLNFIDTIGDLYFHDNALQSLHGLESLKYTGGLYCVNNNALLNFEGLNSLNYCEHTFEIQNNNSLINFQGLDSLIYIGGDFLIFLHNSLINFSGLESLSLINGVSIIGFNDSLINLSGLNNVTEIKDGIDISRNDNLISLEGLQGITNIQNIFMGITIYNNPNLTDISAIASANIICHLNISYNDNLSNCAIQSICNYITNFPNWGSFSNNAHGCNCYTEVDSICNLTGIEDLEKEQFISVSPNPASTTINISSFGKPDSHQAQTITIYNQTGQVVLQTNPMAIGCNSQNYNIDISVLPVGSYFIRVIGNDMVWAEKFIVMR